MKTRNTALDVYRILCMFLITTIHIINYSGLMEALPDRHLNFWLVNGIQVLQVFSISGFTLISSYYLVDKPFRLNRILRFAMMVIFFSIVIYMLSLVLVGRNFSLLLLVKSFFPLTTYHYWYPVNYLFLLALSPFLNKLIGTLTQKKLLVGLGVLALICSVYFHLNPFTDAATFLGHHTHNLLWFVLLYGIAFGLVDSYPIIRKLLQKVDLLSYNSVLSLLFTVSSFVLFTQIRLTPPKWLAKALTFTVPAVFVIYLFQEHNAIWDALWALVGIKGWAESYWLVPMMLACFGALFAIAVGIHLLYRLCDKLLLAKLEAFAEKVLTGKKECAK